MAGIQISKIDIIDDTYKLYLEVDNKSYGFINLNADEIDKDKINDSLYQRSVLRHFIHRREN